jgi:hypothetical protein
MAMECLIFRTVRQQTFLGILNGFVYDFTFSFYADTRIRTTFTVTNIRYCFFRDNIQADGKTKRNKTEQNKTKQNKEQMLVYKEQMLVNIPL